MKAFKKGADGKQVPIGELKEGAFFGEMSILTGKPRTATVVASHALRAAGARPADARRHRASHPHVWDVLQEFAAERQTR